VRGTAESTFRHLGGFLLAALWSESREQRFLCNHCDEFFYARTPGWKIARVGLILVVILIAYAMYDWLAHL